MTKKTDGGIVYKWILSGKLLIGNRSQKNIADW
jgi:hypothetical protein